MNFNELPIEKKIELHEELLALSSSVGGKNFFLQMIEDIKKEKPNPLLNKSSAYHYSKGRMSWTKAIYKDTLTQLFTAMRKEEKEGDMLEGLKPKDYKVTMNMMKALKPLEITIKPKNSEDGEGFSFFILDTTQEKKTKVSFIFKAIFFYNVDFVKTILNFEA